ncbi:MAG: hypothetical protein QY317_16505 [Candidatus Jettenia caeni]|nr:MAG: hypothetical protein QY317_16505 [Candidatus Jettenia caeni]
MEIQKRAIFIICNNRELFFSLKRALSINFINSQFFFHDISDDDFENIECPKFKKAGTLIAFFMNDENDENTSRFIKYLRIRRGIRFPLIFCSFLKEEELNKRYGIFGFGISMDKYKSSTIYCPVPVNVSELINSVTYSTPLTDRNYDIFVERFSGRHKNIYYNKVIPLLEKLKQTVITCDYKITGCSDIVKEVQDIIYFIINNYRMTCHCYLPGRKDNINLGVHLINAVKDLSTKQLSENVERLDFLLQQWFQLVTNKIFE